MLNKNHTIYLLTFHVWIGRGFLFSVCVYVHVCLMWICIIFCRSKCKFIVKCYNGFFNIRLNIDWKKITEKKYSMGIIYFFFDKVNKTVCKNGKFTLFTKFISHIWLTVIFNFISHYKSRHFAIWFAKRISCSFSNRIIWRITGARWNISNDRRQCMKEKMKKKSLLKSASRLQMCRKIFCFQFFFPSNSIQIHFRMSIFRKYLLSKHCVSFCKLGDSTQTFIWA